ncbi:DUF4440 domain-containing protein [Xenorhabdus innexi]|uniref:DUF4440 domain-containing protein n=1 Tax=Xenorhabdus innexi TaxID=290109 RepID=A0A1N6MWA8_9GAMM|nr:DUF4440 domain-containing protein [Xenorhabdus innexi]PHM36601.1 hypothetical protein Xinn_01544 [Xenorhabdus innexi]SIP73148.1 conserved hypothetical protein [Xenorhabdus innexi]
MDQENSVIFEIIKNLEVSLHGKNRCNADWLNNVFHDDFLEIGKSGYLYTKKIVVKSLKEEINTVSKIFSKNFNMQILDKNIVLLTYQSYEKDKNGRRYNGALRSSIWQLSASGEWKFRFHQGTKIVGF